MIIKKLSIIILLSVSVALGMESEARWKPVQLDSITDSQKALEIEKDAERRYQEAQTDLSAEKDPEKRKDIELRLQQATYDKAVAQVQEGELAQAAGDKSDENKKKIANAQKSLDTARESISILTADLGKRLETQQLRNPEKLLREVNQHIQNIVSIAPNEPEKKYLSTLDTLEMSFITGINTLIDLDGRDLSDRDKINQLGKARAALVELRNGLEEILASKNANTRIYNAADRIIKSLGRKLNSAGNQTLDLALRIDQEEPGFLKGLVDKFLKWINSFRTNPPSTIAALKTQLTIQRDSLKIIAAVLDLADQINWNILYTDLLSPTREKIDRAQAWLDRAKAISEKELPVDKLVDEVKKTASLNEDLYAGYSNRYYDPEKYQSLFEQLYSYYSKSLAKVGIAVDNAYQALGLTPDATQDEIRVASAKKENLRGTPQGNAAQEAANILNNPISRQNYDAFLRDYSTLKKDYGIDIAKDTIMPSVRNYLKSKGSVEKLALSKSDFESVSSMLQEISMVQIDQERNYQQELYNFNMQISAMEKRLNEIKESRKS